MYVKEDTRLGCKTTTLEFVGILLPFLTHPQLMRSQYVVVKVDNIGCYFGWVNRQSAGDSLANILIRSLHLLASHLACIVPIEHLLRKSCWEACVVDRLSRVSSTTAEDRQLLDSFGQPSLPSCFKEWMCNPVEDWDLPLKLLKYIEKC